MTVGTECPAFALHHVGRLDLIHMQGLPMKTPGSTLAATLTLAIAASLASVAIRAETLVVPSDPLQFERVHLRQTVDSCAFVAQNVRVTLEEKTIVVHQPTIPCLLPGPPAVVDIELGAFPPGAYVVERRDGSDTPIDESIAFRVSAANDDEVRASQWTPLADFSGVWFTPGEGGWGLSLLQGALHGLVGSLYVFDAQGEPTWFTVNTGHWTGPTQWQGFLWRTDGPDGSLITFEPLAVHHRVAGTITLDFAMTPGTEDIAALEYTIGGVTRSKRIRRIRL
jgi:hypothetical protein